MISKYLEQEQLSDLLKFWIQAENFTRNVANFDQTNDVDLGIETLFKQWQSDAVIIYDKLAPYKKN